jgi:hypothetical protein
VSVQHTTFDWWPQTVNWHRTVRAALNPGYWYGVVKQVQDTRVIEVVTSARLKKIATGALY